MLASQPRFLKIRESLEWLKSLFLPGNIEHVEKPWNFETFKISGVSRLPNLFKTFDSLGRFKLSRFSEIRNSEFPDVQYLKKRCLVHLLYHGVDLTLRMRTSGLRIFDRMLMTMDVQYSRLKALGSVVMVLDVQHASAP